MHKLITIRLSHYNEKARWGLDRLGVPYREAGYMPLIHMLPVAWATRGQSDAAADSVSTRFSTPVLVTDGGATICDSSRILRWANNRYATEDGDLYPEPACEDLDRRFSDGLGEHTRRLAYFWGLRDAPLSRALARANVGRAQAALFSALLPVGRRFLQRALRIDAQSAEHSRRAVLAEVGLVNGIIDGRRYLVGDRFSAADLSFACMLALALLVSQQEGYAAVVPTLEQAHPEARAFAEQLRATPAGRHALRMFREERRR
jgi:glutathione S-transferase